MYVDTLSVGPLQPDTIGLSECGFFVRKYISCVLTGLGGRRYSAVFLSFQPSWYMALTVEVTFAATSMVVSCPNSLHGLTDA